MSVVSEAQQRAIRKYVKEKTTSISIRFSKIHDKDVLDFLNNNTDSKRGFIREAVYEKIEREAEMEMASEAQKRADRKYKERMVQMMVRFDKTDPDDQLLLDYIRGQKNQQKWMKKAFANQFTTDSCDLKIS